jgi:hypothetical protein
MAQQIFGPILAFRAKADYSVTGRYKFVKHDASTSSIDGLPVALVCSADGEDAIGVLVDKPKATEMASVQTYDVCKVLVHAAIAIGAKVTTFSDGTARTAVSTDAVLGEAMEAATALGQIISVRLYGGFHAKLP